MDDIKIPVNVIYTERKTDSGIFSAWEAAKGDAYREYRRNWNLWPKKGIVGDFPLNLDIEPTNKCNLACPFCYRTIASKKGSPIFKWGLGSMSMDTYRKIMDQITVDGKSAVPAIKLTHRGEPLLNKNLCEMIRMAKKKGAVDVIINTNGVLMTEDLAIELMDAGVDKVLFSFDSPYKEKYENTRVGAAYGEVLDNIRAFCSLRNSLKAYGTLIRVGMVVTDDVTEREKEDFYDLFSGCSDLVSYNAVHEEILIDAVGNFTDKNGIRKNVKEYKFADSQLWQRMTINWDGEAEICCENYKQEWELGNIHDSSVHDLWHGEQFRKVREAHAAGRWWEIPQCRKCTIPHMS